MSATNVTACQRTGKRGYPSKRLAISMSRGAGNRLRAYFCRHCHAWHVTSDAHGGNHLR